MAHLFLDLQIATNFVKIPTKATIKHWMKTALIAANRNQTTEITVRFVDKPEITALNHQFRHKNYATNVLSFPFNPINEMSDTPFIGDLVIALAVVQEEAIAQKKTYYHHLTHMIIHGLLHLLEYDHVNTKEAAIMEALEIDILRQLNIKNPYEEHL